MSFLMTAVITKSLVFSHSPDHRPAYVRVRFCFFYFSFYSLDSRKDLQEHKTRAGGRGGGNHLCE